MTIQNLFGSFLMTMLLAAPVLAATPSFGKVSKLNHAQYEKQLLQSAPWFADQSKGLSEAEYKAMVKTELAKSSFRAPAADLESMMSSEFKTLRDRIVSVQNAQQLHELLTEIETNLANGQYQATDTRFFMSQFVVFKEFRGIIYRLYKLAHSNKVTHSLLLTQVKSAFTAIDFYFPGQNQWKAGFEYLTEAYAVNGRAVAHFQNEGEVQVYFSTNILRALEVAKERIENIDLSRSSAGNQSGYVVWDNQILLNSQSFDRDVDRYRLAGNIEKLAVLGAYERAMAQLCLKRAYSMNGFFKVAYEVGRLYGIDGFASEVDGVPMAKLVQIYRRQPEYGMGFSDTPRWTARALAHFRRSLNYYSRAFEFLERRDSNERFVISGAHSKVFGDVTKKTINQLKELLNENRQPVSITSRTRKADGSIEVDLPRFFNEPPTSLQSMMSTEWKGYSANGTKNTDEWSKNSVPAGNGLMILVDRRDYSIGQATNWRVETYRKMFPKVASGDDLKRHVRILSETWGGTFVGLPFAEYVR